MIFIFMAAAMLLNLNSFPSTLPSPTEYNISARSAPFSMPIISEKFSIFQPIYDMDNALKDPQLIASPKSFQLTFEKRIIGRTQWSM